MNDDIQIVILTKGKETYEFHYPVDKPERALRHFGRFASDPELSFSWYDASRLAQVVRAEKHNAQT